MCRAVWPYLIAAGGGVIINMSSLAAVTGSGETAYAVTQGPAASVLFTLKAGSKL